MGVRVSFSPFSGLLFLSLKLQEKKKSRVQQIVRANFLSPRPPPGCTFGGQEKRQQSSGERGRIRVAYKKETKKGE